MALKIAPPKVAAVFAVSVQWVSVVRVATDPVMEDVLLKIAPPSSAAELPESVHCVSVSLPPL